MRKPYDARVPHGLPRREAGRVACADVRAAPATPVASVGTRATRLRVRAARHRQPLRDRRTPGRVASRGCRRRSAPRWTMPSACATWPRSAIPRRGESAWCWITSTRTSPRRSTRRSRPRERAASLSRLEVHYTPKHGSWLNMAEIEISIFERGCLRVPWLTAPPWHGVSPRWRPSAMPAHATIHWQFTSAGAHQAG